MVDVDRMRRIAIDTRDDLASSLLIQAADEIEALRKGLAQILDLAPVELALDPEWAQRKARALLKGTPDNGQG